MTEEALLQIAAGHGEHVRHPRPQHRVESSSLLNYVCGFPSANQDVSHNAGIWSCTTRNCYAYSIHALEHQSKLCYGLHIANFLSIQSIWSKEAGVHSIRQQQPLCSCQVSGETIPWSYQAQDQTLTVPWWRSPGPRLRKQVQRKWPYTRTP